MVLLDHGTPSSIQSVQGRKSYNLISYGKNVFRQKLKQLIEKHYLEMITMLQLLIPEEEKDIIISKRKLVRGIILLRSFKRINREITSRKISPLINVTIVTRQDPLPKIVWKRKKKLGGRIKKDIMLTQQKKKKKKNKNLLRSQQNQKLNNMFSRIFIYLQRVSHIN